MKGTIVKPFWKRKDGGILEAQERDQAGATERELKNREERRKEVK